MKNYKTRFFENYLPKKFFFLFHSKIKSCEKRFSPVRYCERHKKHSHIMSRRQHHHLHHSKGNQINFPSESKKSSDFDGDIGRKIFDEITRIDVRCAELREQEEVFRNIENS